MPPHTIFTFFFFNDPPTTEIYTLSLHDALPICHGGLNGRRKDRKGRRALRLAHRRDLVARGARDAHRVQPGHRSEEHTSELQSHVNLVCRLLLEKKKK